jgi:precorrin-6B methylase 2
MLANSLLRTIYTLLICAFASAGFAAEPAKKPFEPYSGQPGKDVVWVPTAQPMVNRMLDLAQVKAGDVHFDLGSGDGRTVITASKRGAKSTGIEYNPDMVELSKANAAKEGATGAVFMKADLFETDFSHATVVTLFLLPDINLKLRPKILDMKPGTRIVSNTFTMGEWKDDETATVEEAQGCSYYCTAHLWIVPAKVAGVWQMPQGELTLTQEFQMLGGSLKGRDKSVPVWNGRLRGDIIHFTINNVEYAGRVSGDTMTGRLGGSGEPWTATRGGKPAAK